MKGATIIGLPKQRLAPDSWKSAIFDSTKWVKEHFLFEATYEQMTMYENQEESMKIDDLQEMFSTKRQNHKPSFPTPQIVQLMGVSNQAYSYDKYTQITLCQKVFLWCFDPNRSGMNIYHFVE